MSKAAEGLGWVIQASPRRAGVLREDERDWCRRIRSGDSRIDSGARPFGEGGGESSKGRHRCSTQFGDSCDVARQRGGAGEDLCARELDDEANSQLGCPRGGILLPHPTQKVGAVQGCSVRSPPLNGESEPLLDSFCDGSMEILTSKEGWLIGVAPRRSRPPSPSPLLRSPNRGVRRRTPLISDPRVRGPSGRDGVTGKLDQKEKTYFQNPPARWAAREDKYNAARARRRRRDFSNLIWVRRICSSLESSRQMTVIL